MADKDSQYHTWSWVNVCVCLLCGTICWSYDFAVILCLEYTWARLLACTCAERAGARAVSCVDGRDAVGRTFCWKGKAAREVGLPPTAAFQCLWRGECVWKIYGCLSQACVNICLASAPSCVRDGRSIEDPGFVYKLQKCREEYVCLSIHILYETFWMKRL